MKMEQTGRLTLPTDADVVAETLRLKNLLGADALRDCDGTEMPKELLTDPAKKYATYYTTRKDNAWAEANPDEVQQEYLISDRHTARGTKLRIHLMDGFHTQQLKVNTLDDPKRWWEVIDRTTGEVVPTDKWFFDEPTGEVEIETVPYHEYTVSFLAFLIWDPVHMYNFLTNDWKDTPHQLLVANLKSGYSVDYGMLMLGVLICTLPTAIIFLCLQKSFANGITGAVK